MAFINDVAPGQVISSATWGNRIRDQVISTVANLAAAPATPVEGQHIYTQDTDRVYYYNGTSWCPVAGQCIARGNRTTSSSTTTSEIGVISVAVDLKAGQMIIIKLSPLLLYSNTFGDFVFGRLRYTTDGSTPGMSSTILATVAGYTGAAQSVTPLVAKYVPGSDITFGLLLTTGRGSGTGTVGLVVNSNVPDIDLMIMAAGADPGDTGVDI